MWIDMTKHTHKCIWFAQVIYCVFFNYNFTISLSFSSSSSVQEMKGCLPHTKELPTNKLKAKNYF